jgi:DNA repair photolyase
MIPQTTLPFPSCAPAFPFGAPAKGATTLRRRASGVEYLELPVREVLNRNSNPHLPFVWSINPYRGCEFGCTYCYARYTHAFFDLEAWQDFERKIFVKKAAAGALEKRLRRMALRNEPIAIGTATDPYQPAEAHYRVTASLLEVFRRCAGLQISIATKSPLILRDLELLSELDRRHSVTVNFTLTCLDTVLARRIEQAAPDPRARLRAAEAVAAAGIETRIFCMPVMPGINDGEGQLRRLFEAATNVGASDVLSSPLFLRPAARARFWPWLAEEFPKLVPLYERLYGQRDYLPAPAQDDLLADFRRLKLEYGFPVAQAGRG